MKRSALPIIAVAILLLVTFLNAPNAVSAAPSYSVTPVPGDPLTGTGVVARTVLTYADLMTGITPSANPLSDDTAAFGIPANAAPPTNTFQGTLALSALSTNIGYTKIKDSFTFYDSRSNYHYLPTFSQQFVQNGSYLIPVVQGLQIVTGQTAYNYIIGPGRVWDETTDLGYSRASFPFALVLYNNNCVFNGLMTFLFKTGGSPNVSNVRYQIDQETCDFCSSMPGAKRPLRTPSRRSPMRKAFRMRKPAR